MAVDKNLFLYDVSIAAILKNEGHYLKEWLDYHLLAGVNHFYIYDNESTDDTKEILKPYIDARVVTYTFWPGTSQQFPVYNDALKKCKYYSRYTAFIDGDEFIFPQNNKTIPEVVEEIFSLDSDAGVLCINGMVYGSNYQEKADYSKGVLERFTRRAPKDLTHFDERTNNWVDNAVVKNIINPRYVDFIGDPHFIAPMIGRSRINEQGKIVNTWSNYPVMYDKIFTNHYHSKSREEFIIRLGNGDAVFGKKPYGVENFDASEKVNNAEFDDSILKYRDARYYSGGA